MKRGTTMEPLIKRNIFLLCFTSILFLVLELMTTWQTAIISGIGFALLISTMIFKRPFIRQIFVIISLFLIVLSTSLTRSIWLFLLSFILVLIIFKVNQGNEFIVWGESLLHPFDSRQKYHGIKLVSPQSQQRTLLKQKGIVEAMEEASDFLEWNDINLVYFGGDSIVDLGNTILPERESIIVIRKVFGRTRIIVPNDIGLHLNVSAISGRVIFESQVYPLVGENFRWESPAYSKSVRQLKFILSVSFGEFEVIVL